MSVAPAPAPAPLLELPREPGAAGDRRAAVGRWAAVAGTYVAALGVYALVVALRGADPLSVFGTMVQSTLLNWGALQETLLRAVPLVLAALAVTVPARAGMVNVGGEGQLIIGAVAAAGAAIACGRAVAGPLVWIAMAVAGAAAGGLWAGIAGVLRTTLGANEAVSTLLMNFVANDVMLFLIYQPWKYAKGSGQPESAPLVAGARLPQLFGSQLDLGVVVALVVALVVWVVVRRTGWGFALRVVGGNREAGRRAGLPVGRLLVSAMVVGGMLAGLGGMLNFAGLEHQLRPGITASFGYVAFLAAFLGRNDPPKVVLSALLFAAIEVSGNGVQLGYGLDGSVVDVLLAMMVVAPLVMSRRLRGAR